MGMSLSKLREIVKDGSLGCCSPWSGNWTRLSDSTTTTNASGTGDLSSERCLLVASILQGLTLHTQGSAAPLGGTTRARLTCRSQQLLRLFSFSLLCMPPCPPPVPSMHGWVEWLCCFRLPLSPHACMPSCSCSRILPFPGMIHRGQAAPLTEVGSSHPSF